MKTTALLLMLAGSLASAAPEINTVNGSTNIQVTVADANGEPLEGARVRFVVIRNDSGENQSDQQRNTATPGKQAGDYHITDASGMANIACPGSVQRVGEDESQRALFISGEFQIEAKVFNVQTIPFRTIHPVRAHDDLSRMTKLALKLNNAEQGGADRHAAAPESKPSGEANPDPESKPRPQ